MSTLTPETLEEIIALNTSLINHAREYAKLSEEYDMNRFSTCSMDYFMQKTEEYQVLKKEIDKKIFQLQVLLLGLTSV